MIRLLQGQIVDREERSVTLMVNGVGYRVLVPKTLNMIDDDEITLQIHTHVREDDISLYGFSSKKELRFFELLLSISGVGPKMALEILSEPEGKIQTAIFTGNIQALTKISGVGKKTAERIVLELKSKVTPSDEDGETNQQSDMEISGDVLITLEGLGYKRNHIQKVLSNMERTLDSEEEMIRYFLSQV